MVQEIDDKKFFTIKEAAALLRRCRLTVWRWTVDGKIEFHQPAPNGKILIPGHAIKSRIKNF
jgi:excisionase family DNA binding protein